MRPLLARKPRAGALHDRRGRRRERKLRVSVVIIETIFGDGSSYAARYHFSTEAEALFHAWQVARLTGKAIKTVHVMHGAVAR